jgi:hypothetical protein
VGTNITGTAAGLTAGNVTTNANLTGAITSVGNATLLGSFSSANLAGALTDETGTGSAVFANSPTLVTPALGTPASGVVTNLTGTASININGTVGATTASTGAFTTLAASGDVTLSGGTANGVSFLNASKVLTTGSALVFDSADRLIVGAGSAVFGSRIEAVAVGNGDGIAIRGRSSDNLGRLSFIQNASATSLADLRAETGFLAFSLAGSEQMRLTSTGLGIGTSAPASRLDVRTSGEAANLLLVSDISTSALASRIGLGNSTSAVRFSIGLNGTASELAYVGTEGAFPMYFQTNGTERMRIDSAGNVGIGTSSPGAKLEVLLTSTTDSSLRLRYNSSSIYGNHLMNGGGDYVIESPASNGVTSGNFRLRAGSTFSVSTNNNAATSPQLTLDSSGNLGLGVAPSAWGSNYKAVEVSGAVNVFGNTGDLNFAGIGANLYHNNTNYLYRYSTLATMYLQDNGTHQWHIAPSGTAGDAISFTQALTLDASSNLLLGTTSTTYGSIPGKFTSCSATAGSAGLFYTGFSGDVSTSALNIGKFDNDNSTSQIFVKFGINNAGTGSGQINADGGGAVAFGSFSDRRLKENIEPLASQLSNICALNPVEFDYKTGGHQIGFIAQEMQEIYPDTVGEDSDGMLSITGWSKTEARLVKAIQELKAEFDAYKAAHP